MVVILDLKPSTYPSNITIDPHAVREYGSIVKVKRPFVAQEILLSIAGHVNATIEFGIYRISDRYKMYSREVNQSYIPGINRLSFDSPINLEPNVEYMLYFKIISGKVIVHYGSTETDKIVEDITYSLPVVSYWNPLGGLPDQQYTTTYRFGVGVSGYDPKPYRWEEFARLKSAGVIELNFDFVNYVYRAYAPVAGTGTNTNRLYKGTEQSNFSIMTTIGPSYTELYEGLGVSSNVTARLTSGINIISSMYTPYQAEVIFQRASLNSAPNLKFNINGELKEADKGWVNINGELKEIDKMWTNINGELKEV